MGIGLDAFRTAVSGSKPWLEVSGKSADKSAIAAKKTSTQLDLSDLTKLDANSLNRAADNVYLRGQLLTGIRASMINAGLMQGGGAVGQGTSYAEKFLAKAEQTLFGELNGGRYELNSAGQDLSTATVKELLAELDQLVPQGKGKSKPLTQLKGAMAKELGKSTTVSEKQCKALLGLTEKAMANLGIKKQKGMSFEKLESYAAGTYVVCTFKDGKGDSHKIAASYDGNLYNGDDFDSLLMPKDNDNAVNGNKNIVNEESNQPEQVGGNDNKINEKLDMPEKPQDNLGMPEKPQESNLDKSVNSLGGKEPLEEINTSIKTKDSQPKPPVKGAEFLQPPDKMLAANCPHATKTQKNAVLGLNPQKIADCLGLTTGEAQELRMTGLKTMANGKYVLCTMLPVKDLEFNSGSRDQINSGKNILVDGDGNLLNYQKTDYGKCRLLLTSEAWMVDSFKPQDLPDINYIMGFVAASRTNAKAMVATMLPAALEKARQLQPKGAIKLETWWKALGLAEFGKPPKANPNDAKTKDAFCNALTARLIKDYESVTGRTVDTDEGYTDRAFAEFMSAGSDGLPYSTRLFCMKYGIAPSLGDYPDGCVLHDEVQEYGLNKFSSVPIALSQLRDTRMGGTTYWLEGQKEMVGKNTGTPADAQKIYSALKESGFTEQQIGAMSKVPNNNAMTFLASRGYAQSAAEAKVSIRHGENGRMIVSYTFPCLKVEGKEQGASTGNTLSYDVTIFPDGSMRSDKVQFNGTDNNALKTIGDGSFRLTAAQSESLLHPDRVALSKLLGIKEKQAAQVKFGDFEPAMGGSVRFTATLPSGETVKLQASRKGGLMLSADVEQLSNVLTPYIVSTKKLAEPLIDAFRPEDMKLAAEFLQLFRQGEDDYLPYQQELGFIPCGVLKNPMINMLITTLPTLPRKSGQTMKDLMPALWKKLGLEGKAPNPKSKAKGVDSAGFKFVSAFHERIKKDCLSVYGNKMDKLMRTAFDPANDGEWLAADESISANPDLMLKCKTLNQHINYLIQPDGLSFENRIKLQKGKVALTMKDFVTVGIMAQSINYQEPAEILSAATSELGGTKRYTGAKFHYQGKVVVAQGSETAGKDAANTVEQLSADGFSPKQIFELAYYLNNAGTALQTSCGLVAYGYAAEMEILPRQNNGDMRVRARLPIVRYGDFKPFGAEQKSTFVGKLSNEYIEHEFTIRTDGTMEATNIRFLSDPKMPESTEVEVKFL